LIMSQIMDTHFSRVGRHEFQPGHNPPFRVRSRFYSSGLCERVGFFVNHAQPVGGYARAVRRKSSDLDAPRSEESVRRSKAALRRLIYSFGPDRMLTLTFRDNVTDFDQAQRAWQSFARGWKRNFPDSPIVAVPERQQRGAWHFHCAVLGFHDLRVIHRIWKHGAVNMRRGKRSGVSRYLAKYMGKDLALLGRAAYRVVNRGAIDKPVVTDVSLWLTQDGLEFPLWVYLALRFGHGATAFFSGGGVYWRLDDHGSSKRDDDQSPVFTACDGQERERAV
jgi:hypothetical protein